MGNYVSDSTRADPHDGKQKVTPEMIMNVIAAQKKGTLHYGCLISGTCFFLSLMALFIMGVASATGAWVPFVTVLLLVLPFAILLGFVYAYKRSIKRLSGSDYAVITDTVERVVEDDKMVRSYVGNRVSYRMEHAMYLTNLGRVVISQSDTYVTSVGDTFYIVVDKKAPREPYLMLNSKYYELQSSE